MAIRLYSYWRSSAAYRVRIALNLKGLAHEIEPISLAPGVAEHRQAAYRKINPQMLVPFLTDGDVAIGQSMAILEYLEETYVDRPLLPQSRSQRSRVRAFCNMIACDIHPILNLRILQYVRQQFSTDPATHWYPHWIHEGFKALEAVADGGGCVFGEQPTMADALLVPQIYNARRFKVPLDSYPKLVAAANNCSDLAGFAAAAPENQCDAEA